MRAGVGVLLVMAVLLVIFRERIPVIHKALSGEKPHSAQVVHMGSGGVTGVFYPIAGAIAKLVNTVTADSNVPLQVMVEGTKASVYNIKALMAGDMQLALAQVSTEREAWNGSGDNWQDALPQKDLRRICTLHVGTLMLIAAQDSDIHALSDIRGHKVGVGYKGAALRNNVKDVLETIGLHEDVDFDAVQLPNEQITGALERGDIDAFFFVSGHPTTQIVEVSLSRRPVRFVPLVGLEDLLLRKDEYSDANIPVALYPHVENTEDVPTIGIKTVLLTSAAVPERVVYGMTRAIFEHLPELRTMHLGLQGLTLAGMADREPFSPYHPGTLRYFQETGMPMDAAAQPPVSDAYAVGTASPSGVFYAIGGAVGRLVNRHRAEDGFRLQVLSTKGSVQNIKGVSGGYMGFAVVQSNTIAAAVRGQGTFQGVQPQRNLRTVFNLHVGTDFFLVGADNDIKTLADLRGKRVDIGSLDSGHHYNAVCILDYFIPDWRASIAPQETSIDVAVQRLVAGELDAVFYNVGHPSALIKQAVSMRGVRILPIPPEEGLLKKYPHFVPAEFPAALYPGLEPQPLMTTGVEASLITSVTTPDEVVYHVMQQVFEHAEEFASMHPSLKGWTREKATAHLMVPLHPGAKRYLTEKGLSHKVVTLPQEREIRIAGGQAAGAFFPTAGVVAQVLTDADVRVDGEALHAYVVPSEGSDCNIAAVVSGEADFGLAQATYVYDAAHGERSWEGRAQEQLRVVCSLNTAALTLVAAEQSQVSDAQRGGDEAAEHIRSMGDLTGKRVSYGVQLGKEGRKNAINLFSMQRFVENNRWRDSLDSEEPPIDPVLRMLDDGVIDAFFYTTFHPSDLITRSTRGTRRVQILPVTGLNRQILEYPYIVRTVISGQLYPDATMPAAVPTVGVPTLLVTSAKTDDALVAQVMRTLIEKADVVRSMHPSLASLTRAGMTRGLAGTIHPGALAVHQQAGLIATRQREVSVFLGSDRISSLFYPVAGALVNVLEGVRLDGNITLRASVEITSGSADNIDRVLSGEIDFGIASNIITSEAHAGEGRWATRKDRGLLWTLFPLYQDAVNCIAQKDSGIHTLADLRGKRLLIVDSEESRQSAEDILATVMPDWRTAITLVPYQSDAKAYEQWAGREVDAVWHCFPHPSAFFRDFSGWMPGCSLVPITVGDAFLAAHPAYRKGVIDTSEYKSSGNTGPVATLLADVQLVTSRQVNPEVVKAVCQRIIAKADVLSGAVSVLRGIPAKMEWRDAVVPGHGGGSVGEQTKHSAESRATPDEPDVDVAPVEPSPVSK